VHLVGFIIKIYHDARSPERQIQLLDRAGYKEKVEGCVYNPSNEKGKEHVLRGTQCTNVRNWKFNVQLYHTVIYYDHSNNQ